MQLLLHPTTAQQIDDFIASPSHALMLCGPVGSGKGTVASFIAAKALGIDQQKLTDHPYVRWIRDLEKGVAIENIRDSQTFMQLKTPGKQAIRRVLIVEQGETMSTAAQNAFLKLLEEPPADSLIIITTTGAEQVLPTIRSRAQVLHLLPPSLDQLTDFFSNDYSKPLITKAYYISEGYVSLMKAILDQDTAHPLVNQIEVAKSLLSSSTYERLCKIDELTKQKNLSLLLQALERVSHAALMQSSKTESPATKRWASRLKLIIKARSSLDLKAGPKLLLTDLMLNL